VHRRFATLAAAAAALSTQPVSATPIPQYTGGFLTGVTNLDTSLGAFNVEWRRATCAEVYGAAACTFSSSTGFQFSKAEALEVTKGLDVFMSTMDKTLLPGYKPETGNSFTSVLTPYAMGETFQQIGPNRRKNGEEVKGYATHLLGNDNRVVSDAANGRSSRTLPTARVDNFATWTPYTAPPTAVPEPASWLLMGLGLGALGLASRQRAARRAGTGAT